MDAETNRQPKSAPPSPSATLTPDRRQLLKAAGLTVGLSGVLPTQTVAQQEQNPPDLEHVYINITVSGDLQCLLIAKQEFDSPDQKQQVIESLSATDPQTGTEVQAESQSLDLGFFYNQYTLEDRDISPEDVQDRLNESVEKEPIGEEERDRLEQLTQKKFIPAPLGGPLKRSFRVLLMFHLRISISRTANGVSRVRMMVNYQPLKPA